MVSIHVAMSLYDINICNDTWFLSLSKDIIALVVVYVDHVHDLIMSVV